MKIDLRKLPVFVINMADDREKRRHAKQVLDGLGFANVTVMRAVECKPGRIGCGLSHIRAMNEAGYRCPFIVFEDDISPTKFFTPVIDVPADAHMVHLGACNHGWVPQFNPGVAVPQATLTSPHAPGFLRLHNMMSQHALLYLKAEFADRLRGRIIDWLVNPNRNDPHGDIALAELQRTHTVLAPEQPFFYQDARFGGQETHTRITLQSPSFAPELRFDHRSGEKHFVLAQGDGYLYWKEIN